MTRRIFILALVCTALSLPVDAAVQTKVGSLITPDVTGNSSTTGVGFQPDVVLFWTVKVQNTAQPSAASDMVMAFGAARTSTERWAMAAGSDNAQASQFATRRSSTVLCIVVPDPATDAIIEGADFVSQDADGFTLNWTTVVANDFRVYYMAIGGVSAKLGTFTTPTSTGSQSVTGVGFEPDVVLFGGSHSTGSVTTGNDVFALGMASSATDDAAAHFSGVDASAPTVEKSQQIANSAFIQGYAAGTENEFDLTSFDAGGFTVNHTTVDTVGNRILYLALGGVSAKVGEFPAKSTTGTLAVTGLGFQPVGVFFTGIGEDPNTLLANAKFVIGAASSSTADGSGAVFSEDNVATSNADNRHNAKAVMSIGSGGTVQVDADLSTFDSGGFTMNWTTADANARDFIYLAIGEPLSDANHSMLIGGD